MFRKKQLVDSTRIAQVCMTAEAKAPARKRLKDIRRSTRYDSWKQCTISCENGYRVAAIMVDHSRTGARVRLRSYETLPALVTLIVSSLGVEHSCKVVWCRRGDAGLQFV
ncbi:MAG: PilZ domain-containing protein [Hyphomonadaceae bacterium]